MALIRIGFGAYFVAAAARKIAAGWLVSGDQLTKFNTPKLEAATPPYDTFLANVVLPNSDLFARLVVLGESVAGILLALGLLTRLGAAAGAWQVLNYMLAKGLPDYDGGTDRIFLLVCLVLGITAAGLVWGLDGVLRPRLASNRATRWLSGITDERQVSTGLTEPRGRPQRWAA
jgi:uncharacterized membrane protein YphA (DoxX/SURF4 family)